MASSAPSGSPVQPFLEFRGSRPDHFPRLIDAMYNGTTTPSIAPLMRSIVLRDDIDGPGNSQLLPFLYHRNWDNRDDGRIPGNVLTRSERLEDVYNVPGNDNHVYRKSKKVGELHPFTAIRDDVFLATFEDTADAVRASPPQVYLSIIAQLLSVCVNLRYIFVPQQWLDQGFDTTVFPNLIRYGATENLLASEVAHRRRNRRDSAVGFV